MTLSMDVTQSTALRDGVSGRDDLTIQKFILNIANDTSKNI